MPNVSRVSGEVRCMRWLGDFYRCEGSFFTLVLLVLVARAYVGAIYFLCMPDFSSKVRK